MKPPMPYSGGKQTVADQIVNLFPDHDHYVEPFGGALSVLLAKPVSKIETVNDLNGDLITFWQVLRDRTHELERICALTPHSREEFLRAKDLTGCEDLERARRVWVQLTQSRGAQLNQSTGWRFVHGTGRMALAKYLDGYLERIAPAAHRLRSVSIENRPALDVIAAYGRPDALLYVDPPYLSSTRHGTQYEHELITEEDHLALLSALRRTPAAVVLSGYESELYAAELEGWTTHTMGAQAMTGDPRTEVVWMNRRAEAGLW